MTSPRREYCLSRSTNLSLRGSEVIVQRGDQAVALHHSLLGLILEFEAPRDPAEAYATRQALLSPDELEELLGVLIHARILEPVVAGALTAADESLKQCWNPDVFERPDVVSSIAEQLRAGRPVLIRNAFSTAHAESVHATLDGFERWRPYEGGLGHFHYRHHNIYDRADFPEVLSDCFDHFDSPLMKRTAHAMSGCETDGEVTFSASSYRPGDYSLPHDDSSGQRTVAFVWHLTRSWRPAWGGQLFWCPSLAYVEPTFNTLILFNVTPRSLHFVCPVSAHAQGKRLAVNGWWNRPARDQEASATSPMGRHHASDLGIDSGEPVARIGDEIAVL